MAQHVELLLLENVDNLGIVGDVVKVRTGYARNFLLPRGLATEPSQELIDQLAEKRKKAEADLSALRAKQADLVEKLEGYELHVVRSCNDQGQLYGSVTQQDIADALQEAGFDLLSRDVRLGQTVKRVDRYDVPIRFTNELVTEIVLVVDPDRPLDLFDEPEASPAEGEASAEDAQDADADAEGEPGEATAEEASEPASA